MKLDIPEILAPAGSPETLSAALRAGADAVYVGGKRFSARSNAGNFSLQELEEAAKLCHIYNAQLHLAVNTIISDDEIPEFLSYIKSAAAAGVDAFIVQDLGAAYIIIKALPKAVIHGSTQMSVHTLWGAALLEKMGYSRIVPARELDSITIGNISGKLNIETEIFSHGALCMSVSGQCYMSAVIGSRSANRGSCGQPCRLPFSACGNKNYSALSLKDLSLLPIMDKVLTLNVDSLKIEGRMKRPEYVASAVHSMYLALHGQTPDMQMLRRVFSRNGFTYGYFSGDRKDMFGVRLKEDGQLAQSYFPEIHELYRSERKIRAVNFHCLIKKDRPVLITAQCGGFSAEAEGDVPQTAINRPTDADMLEKQLSRLGDTVFYLDNISADIDDGLMIPAGKLNQLRRQLIEDLSQQIINAPLKKITITDFVPEIPKNRSRKNTARHSLRVFCSTAEQAMAAEEYAEYLVLPAKLLLNKTINIPASKIIISPPRFIVNEEKLEDQLRKLRDMGYEHLLCHTMDSIAVGKKLKFALHGNFTLNAFNSLSIKALADLGLRDIVVSFEAKISQIQKLSSEIPLGAVTYGYLPLMLTRNCPIKNEMGNCSDCSGFLKDRTDRTFPVICHGDFVEILNSDCLYMTDKPELASAVDFSVIMLHKENAQETQKILKGIKPSGNITRGLYYRGI